MNTAPDKFEIFELMHQYILSIDSHNTELFADSAEVENSYWVAEAATTPGIVATGFYADTLKKENGAWKIARRKQVVDPSFKMN